MQALVLHPTGAGTALAAVALAAGAPLFSDGLRALRLRRAFRGLHPVALTHRRNGMTHVTGRVALESPLFSPLSGRPCAGFRLEVSTAAQPQPRRVDEWRDFRIEEGGASARVMGRRARWDLAVTAERDAVAGAPLTEHVRALLERVPEARWLRDSGAPLRLVEHALFAGASCHVVGFARHSPMLRLESVELLERTGTDDGAIGGAGGSVIAAEVSSGEPDLWLGPGDQLDFLLVSDASPRPGRLRVPALRLGGLGIGPALSLGGMLYLAHVADWLRAHGGF